MGAKVNDPSMDKVRDLFEASGLSLQELGTKMGYEAGIARQSAFQFLKAGDPRVSMLRRFAAAMSIPVRALVDEKRKRPASRSGLSE